MENLEGEKGEMTFQCCNLHYSLVACEKSIVCCGTHPDLLQERVGFPSTHQEEQEGI